MEVNIILFVITTSTIIFLIIVLTESAILEILETPRKPKNQVEGLVGLDVAKYMQEHIFMFGGKSIRAKFEMPSYLISDVLDAFRANVDFKDLGDEMVLASVKVNEKRYALWARQYASQIKITEPKELDRYVQAGYG